MALGQPTLTQVSRARLLGLLAIVVGFVALAVFLAGAFGPERPLLPIMPYLALIAYMIAARRLIAAHHRRGCRAFARGDLETAIAEMEASDAFFLRHGWLDRWRLVTMLSPSAIGYREMALLNIGFFQSQLGRKEAAKTAYRRALAEFPESRVARQTLKMIETFEQPSAV